jgi:predicted CXXCH cytochrome family protein
MEQRDGRFYQTGFRAGGSQTERFDLVIGSGRRGQSYLYWKDGLLFQLPVSYHAGSRRWINSPGYEDGAVHFGRGIPPQCLDCHASNFRLEPTATGLRYADDYSLGIKCGKCHGEADKHEKIIRPSGLDLCARCHSGLKEEAHPEPDVHGNQVGLLKASRCFQRSGSMTCSTCHDVHRVERDLRTLSSRCGVCHGANSCRTATHPDNRASTCVECHMPLAQSKLIEVQTYRTHKVGVYLSRDQRER